jgi:DNA-binding transcriptional ArsR family regulator
MFDVDQGLFAAALADATRRDIMKHLCCVWLTAGQVVQLMEGRVNQPTVSHHLKKLEESHLVHVRQEGRNRFYTLNQEYFTCCCNALVATFAPECAPLLPVEAISLEAAP